MSEEKIELTDFNNWTNTSHDFTLNDYIHAVFVSKNLPPDLFFAFMQLFWPEFVLLDDYVFIKSQRPKKEKISKLKSQKENVEFWGNLINIDGFFTKTSQEFDNNTITLSKRIAQSLVEAWSCKLKNEYPTLNFIVKFIFDEETDEVFVTFYQKTYETFT